MSIESAGNQNDLIVEKKPTFWQKLKKAYIKNKPYLVSHHPNCEKYEEHVFIISGKKFCIGCFIGYPAAIAGIGISFPLVFFGVINVWIILIIGILFSLATLLSLTQFTKKRARKILQKMLIGMGSGFIITSLWIFMGFAWYFKIFVIWGTIIVLNIPISVMHYKTHNKICKKCEWKNNWNECPGFRRNEIENKV
ncbi:MAG: hypothetical protein ACTSRE_16225 [Promethearchaeota archaeon]